MGLGHSTANETGIKSRTSDTEIDTANLLWVGDSKGHECLHWNYPRRDGCGKVLS